jgi:hypothetical protein
VLKESLGFQVEMAKLGMDEVLVNIDGFYATLLDYLRASDIQNPEKYYVDPRSDESKAAAKKKQQASAREQQLQRSLMQQAVSLEQMRTAFDKYKADQETQFKYWSETLRAEIEEAKIVGDATVKLIAPPKEASNGSKNGSGKPREKSAPTGVDRDAAD